MQAVVKNKWNYFILVCLTMVAIYILLNNYYQDSTKENYTYSIATLLKTNSKGKAGWENEFQYLYNNRYENGRNNISKDSVQYYEGKIGKRYLVRINKNEWVNKLFFTTTLYINKPVPDSIKKSPSEGWKELPVWAK